MAILRIEKNRDFTQIKNDCLRDERLSWKARGILAYLLTLPDGWEVFLKEIQTHSQKDGKESFASGIKELKELGYFETIKGHDKKGKMYTYNIVREDPKKPVDPSPEPKKPQKKFENPTHGKPGNRETRQPGNPEANKYLSNKYLRINTATTTTGIPEVLDFYQNNFGVLNPFTMENIMQWQDEVGKDLILESMKRAAKENKSWRYAESILKDWARHNIKTLEQVKAADISYKNKHVRRHTGRSNPVRQERLPEWFKHEYGKAQKPQTQESKNHIQIDNDETLEEKRKRLEKIREQYKKQQKRG